MNNPQDQSSRWSSGSNNQQQFITIKLDRMSVAREYSLLWVLEGGGFLVAKERVVDGSHGAAARVCFFFRRELGDVVRM